MITSNFIRPMNFVQLTGALVGIYRKSFIPLTIMTLINAVLSLLFLKLVFSFQNETIAILAFIVFLLLPVMYTGPILVAMSNTILGNKVQVLDSYRQGLAIGPLSKTFLAALPASVVAFIVSLLASYEADFSDLSLYFYLIFFVLMPTWVFFPMALVLEKKGYWQSVSRSFKIFFANLGRTILIFIVSIIFSLPVLLLGYFLDALLGDFVLNTYGEAAVGITYAVPFITMFAISYFVLAYYETRARSEGYTADNLSQELGFAPLDEMMSM